MTDPKCDACNLIETLSPCSFCNQPVVMRYNTMTGEHYISHEDWNSRCPQRPFYGARAKWNSRPIEDALRAENERLHDIIQAAYDTFRYGGTDPADDDVISVLMAKILEEALT